MRKVIEGKAYDTKTAKQLHSWSNMDDDGNFDYMSEIMYRTTKGAYFIVGEGGAKTKYRTINGNTAYGSEDNFSVLTDEEARKWLEEHDGPANVIEECFTIQEA